MKLARNLFESLRTRSALPWTLTLWSSLTAGSWVLALSVFGHPQRFRRSIRSHLWTVSPLLVLAAQSLIAGRPAQGAQQFSEAIIVVAALQTEAPRQRLRTAMILAIIGLSTLSAISGALHRSVWHRLYGTTQTPLVGIGPTGGVFRIDSQSDDHKTEVSQTWRVPEGHMTDPIVVRYRLHSGQPDLAWRVSDGITQVTHGSDRNAFTHVAATTGKSGAIERQYDSPTALGGTRLRVSLDYRGRIHAFVQNQCEGIAIQVRSTAWSGTCVPLNPGVDSWLTTTYQWTVPSQQSAKSLWLELVLGPRSALDIRNVRVEQWGNGTWTPLAPSEPSGLAVYMAWRTGLQAPIQSTFIARGIPTTSWKSLLAPVPTRPAGATYLTVRASLEPGLSIDVAESTRSGTISLHQASPSDRRALWFGHPNLLGHTVASGTVAAMALGRTTLLGALMLLLAGTPALVESGSRAAALAVLVSALAFMILWMGRHRWRTWLAVGITACAIVGTLLVAAQNAPDMPRLASLAEVVPRYDIWAGAIRAFESAPLKGPGNASLVEFGNFGPGNVPTHAHNLFLEGALQNGIIGLLAIVWFYGRLAQFAWRNLRWRGAILAGAILMLNLVDVTLFFGTVLIPFLVSITSVDTASEAPPKHPHVQMPPLDET